MMAVLAVVAQGGEVWMGRDGKGLCGHPAQEQVVEDAHQERLAQSGSTWSGDELIATEKVQVGRQKVVMTKRKRGWIFMTLNLRGHMAPERAGGHLAKLAREKIRRAVEVAERHHTDMLVVTETGIDEMGETLVREMIEEFNAEAASTQKFALTPYFSSATADDGSPMRNRGLMVLLSPRMNQRLAQDGKAVTAALRGRGLSMRFKDDQHGHVRVLAVYGVADLSAKQKAGEEMTGASDRMAVADWVREQGLEARGTAEPSATAPEVGDTTTCSGDGGQQARMDKKKTPEPLMVIGDLNCAAEPADRLSSEKTEKRTYLFKCTAEDRDGEALVSV